MIPETFWGDIMREELHWFEPFETALEGEIPDTQWFVGGKTNLSYNCLDANISAGKGDRGTEKVSSTVLVDQASFFGRPRGLIVDSRLSRFTVEAVHCSVPKGTPRVTLRANASCSFLVIAWLTRLAQLGKRRTGQVAKSIGESPSSQLERLPQR